MQYVVHGNSQDNQLFLSNGDGQFTKVTAGVAVNDALADGGGGSSSHAAVFDANTDG
jgi:hypothetical protein